MARLWECLLGCGLDLKRSGIDVPAVASRISPNIIFGGVCSYCVPPYRDLFLSDRVQDSYEEQEF